MLPYDWQASQQKHEPCTKNTNNNSGNGYSTSPIFFPCNYNRYDTQSDTYAIKEYTNTKPPGKKSNCG